MMEAVATRPFPRVPMSTPLLPSLPARRAQQSSAPNATLVARIDHTPQVATFLVRPDDPNVRHLAGQYATLGLEVDGAPLSRPYSMASLPGGETWEFHIREVREGSFTTRLFALREGARLRLGPAKGRFVLDAADDRPHVFLATGTGIAPFVAMLRAEISSGNPRPVTLIHGAAHANELGYADVLRDLATTGAPLMYLPTISRPANPRNAGWTGATGRAEEVLAREFDGLGFDPAHLVAYLCGNPGMVDTALAALLARGVPDTNVRREAYWLDRPEALTS